MTEVVQITAAPRKGILDWMPTISFGFVVLVQAVVFVWFMAQLDARTSRNSDSIYRLDTQVSVLQEDRAEIKERLVRMETLLTEVLTALRK